MGKQPIIICTLVTSGLCQCVVLKAVLFTVKKRGGKKPFALDNYLELCSPLLCLHLPIIMESGSFVNATCVCDKHDSIVERDIKQP